MVCHSSRARPCSAAGRVAVTNGHSRVRPEACTPCAPLPESAARHIACLKCNCKRGPHPVRLAPAASTRPQKGQYKQAALPVSLVYLLYLWFICCISDYLRILRAMN